MQDAYESLISNSMLQETLHPPVVHVGKETAYVDFYHVAGALLHTRLWPFAEISLRGKGDPERELGGVMSKHRDHLILSRCLSKGSAHGAHSSVSACQNGQSRVLSTSRNCFRTGAQAR